MHRRLALFVLTAVATLISGFAAARADPIVHMGLQFSDELGGFRLLAVTGSGTIEDPITVVEEVSGDNRNVILTIRGLSRDFGNRVGTQHLTAFAMKKIVINRSGNVWRNYQMELREVTTRRSPYTDGLSFGQNATFAEVYAQSNFPHVQRFDEPEDSLGFSGSEVPPGGEATFQFIISDMSPVSQFFLVQIPLQPLSLGEPGDVNWAGR